MGWAIMFLVLIALVIILSISLIIPIFAEKAIAEKSPLIANALLCRIYRRMKAGS